MFGVPIDPDDVIDNKFEQYEAKFRPPYRLLKQLSPEQVSNAQRILEESHLDYQPHS